MQALTVALALAFLGIAWAAPEILHGHQDYYAYPKYKYSYGVNDKHTGDYKSAHEYRDGHLTKGSYSVLQPDGVLRTVNYVVDPKGGFQAEVINKGVAHHAHGKHGHHGHVAVSHHGGGYVLGNGLGDDGILGVGPVGLGGPVGVGLGGVGLGGPGVLGGPGIGLL